ncbi:MAG: hypothetical protein H0Z33_07030 [Bacillaceae bacterium]|nr:hypothetical protein [Bacillaceae bacterium]
MMARSTSWIEVKAITDDPVGEDLAWTTHKLTWDHDGTYAYKNSRDGKCTVAQPSSFGTNWYIDRCAWTYYSVIDGGRTVASDLEADYHNYDFGDDSQRTDVSHDVYIEGYYSGASNYNVTWSKSGEYSSFLDLDVVVNKG